MSADDDMSDFYKYSPSVGWNAGFMAAFYALSAVLVWRLIRRRSCAPTLGLTVTDLDLHHSTMPSRRISLDSTQSSVPALDWQRSSALGSPARARGRQALFPCLCTVHTCFHGPAVMQSRARPTSAAPARKRSPA